MCASEVHPSGVRSKWSMKDPIMTRVGVIWMIVITCSMRRPLRSVRNAIGQDSALPVPKVRPSEGTFRPFIHQEEFGL